MRRWIFIGENFSFQPSEIAKFTMAVLVAHLTALNYGKMNHFKKGIMPVAVTAVPIMLLVLFETHISAAIILTGIVAIILFCGGVNIRWFVILAIIGIIIMYIIVSTDAIKYAGWRFTIWKDPYNDGMAGRGRGFQTIQSLAAIGSGGLMGEGIGGSIIKYSYLPELYNDYIFSIVCEEVGFVGASIVMILFFLLVWRGFIIAARCPDKLGSFMAVGLTGQLGIQVILNVLVVTNTIPPTGVSLPFFSSGGTSLLMLLAQMGVVLSISRNGTKAINN